MTEAAHPPSSVQDGALLDESGTGSREAAGSPQIRVARSRAVGWGRWLEPASLAPTYVGAVVVAIGFALIGLAWSEIAGLTVVSLQMPYLVSAGFTGLGLVMMGLVVINVAAKRQDGAERARQMRTLTETFQSLRQEIASLDLPRNER